MVGAQGLELPLFIKPLSTFPPFVPGLNQKGNWKMSKRDLSGPPLSAARGGSKK